MLWVSFCAVSWYRESPMGPSLVLVKCGTQAIPVHCYWVSLAGPSLMTSGEMGVVCSFHSPSHHLSMWCMSQSLQPLSDELDLPSRELGELEPLADEVGDALIMGWKCVEKYMDACNRSFSFSLASNMSCSRRTAYRSSRYECRPFSSWSKHNRLLVIANSITQSQPKTHSRSRRNESWRALSLHRHISCRRRCKLDMRAIEQNDRTVGSAYVLTSYAREEPVHNSREHSTRCLCCAVWDTEESCHQSLRSTVVDKTRQHFMFEESDN